MDNIIIVQAQMAQSMLENCVIQLKPLQPQSIVVLRWGNSSFFIA